jgi:hypothetical protein
MLPFFLLCVECELSQQTGVDMNLQTAMLYAQRDALYERLYQVIDGGNWSERFIWLPSSDVEQVMKELAEVKRKIKGIEDGE